MTGELEQISAQLREMSDMETLILICAAWTLLLVIIYMIWRK